MSPMLSSAWEFRYGSVHRRCRFMFNRFVPERDTSGRRVIGHGMTMMATTGFRARGYSLPSASFGLPDTGVGTTVSMPGTMDTGDRTSDFMAASITALVTPAVVFMADIGRATATSTTGA